MKDTRYILYLVIGSVLFWVAVVQIVTYQPPPDWINVIPTIEGYISKNLTTSTFDVTSEKWQILFWPSGSVPPDKCAIEIYDASTDMKLREFTLSTSWSEVSTGSACMHVVTLGEPSTLLSQIILFVLYNGMGMFVGAVFELNNMNNLISLQSPKQIIPIYPVRWRTINILMTLGNFAIQLSITLMFLLKNLIPLFVLSTGIMIFWFLWGYLRSWKPIEKELRRRGTLK